MVSTVSVERQVDSPVCGVHVCSEWVACTGDILGVWGYALH